jgi:hypothetical protein
MHLEWSYRMGMGDDRASPLVFEALIFKQCQYLA